MSIAIKKPNLSAKEIEALAVVALVIIGGVVVYKVYHMVSSAADAGADVIGKGSAGKEADKKVKEVKELPLYENPFSGNYILAQAARNPSKVMPVLSAKTKDNLEKFVNRKLSLTETYLHPLSYKQNREDVIALLKDVFKYKTQVSDFSAYFFKKTGKRFFDVLDEGFRNTGWTSGADYQKMFTNFVNHVQNLKAYE